MLLTKLANDRTRVRYKCQDILSTNATGVIGLGLGLLIAALKISIDEGLTFHQNPRTNSNDYTFVLNNFMIFCCSDFVIIIVNIPVQLPHLAADVTGARRS